MSEYSLATLEQILEFGEPDEYIKSLQSTKYLAVACFALLIYDYLLTLEQEVRRIMVLGMQFVTKDLDATILAEKADYHKGLILSREYLNSTLRASVCSK